jgi:signal transduction histidine kinase
MPVATLTVVDDGAGMSTEFVRERLFKPFDTTKGSKGMGIGAYQVREYVRSIGGRVDVASAEGQGTRFTLRVPLSGPPQDGSEHRHAARRSTLRKSRHTGKLRSPRV